MLENWLSAPRMNLVALFRLNGIVDGSGAEGLSVARRSKGEGILILTYQWAVGG